MPDERISTVAKELSEDWDEGSFALYLPRPIVEVGGEKWRIFRKNALSALEDLDVRDGPAVEFIRSLNLAEFGGSGYAIFQSGGGFRHTRLSRRPFASLVRSDAPFILPLLADMSDRDTRWVLALDRNRPRLFLFDGTKLSLREDAFEDVDYEGVEERRLIQDDIFFHSSGRGSSGGARSPSIFHALGADQSRERDKTDEAFYREVIDALMNSLPGHVDRLVIFGDPHTVGPFEKLLAPTGLDVSTHHASGGCIARRPHRRGHAQHAGTGRAFPATSCPAKRKFAPPRIADRSTLFTSTKTSHVSTARPATPVSICACGPRKTSSARLP